MEDKNMNKTELKRLFKNRFTELYPDKRLLAIQLDGFTHRVFYNDHKNGVIKVLTYSTYTVFDPANNEKLEALFDGFPHYIYKHNSIGLIYVKLENA